MNKDTYNLTSPSVIKALMERHGCRNLKSLGQNFLINPSVCPKMAQMCGVTPEDLVIEIGAGVGVLTAELAKVAGKVITIEIDRRLLPILKETTGCYDNVTVVNGDVLKLDLRRLIEENAMGRVFVCANLPYYITSPIIMKLLEDRLPLTAITVMVQKECAERFLAPVGSKNSGAVTLSINYYATAKSLFSVSPSSFMPAPKVDSAVIRFDIREQRPVNPRDEQLYFKIIRAAFTMRRKTAANSISSAAGISKNVLIDGMRRIGLDENIRPERMTLQDFCALTEWLTSS